MIQFDLDKARRCMQGIGNVDTRLNHRELLIYMPHGYLLINCDNEGKAMLRGGDIPSIERLATSLYGAAAAMRAAGMFIDAYNGAADP